MQYFSPPQKTEIQKFWTADKMEEILIFRMNSKISFDYEKEKSILDFTEKFFSPDECESINSIQPNTSTEICQASIFLNPIKDPILTLSTSLSVDNPISTLSTLYSADCSVHLFHYVRETSRTFFFPKIFSIIIDLVQLTYYNLDILSVYYIDCFVILIWDPGKFLI